MLKLIIKFFPALIPLVTYFIWVLFLREIVLLKKARKNVKEKKQQKIINMDNKYSVINDRNFIISVILSFTILIAMFIFLAFSSMETKGDKYIPAKYENGKIIPAQKILEKQESVEGGERESN
jgi:hypothetical protein